MESEKPLTKKCSICLRDIELSKFRLHEAQCARNNYKCPKCGMVVPKVDREQHELDFHTEKPIEKSDQSPAQKMEELTNH